MKIVIADKVSPSTLKVFAEHPDWTVVSPDKEALAAELPMPTPSWCAPPRSLTPP